MTSLGQLPELEGVRAGVCRGNDLIELLCRAMKARQKGRG